MQIEYEATYINVDKDGMRDRLKKVGAKLLRPEFLQKRIVFDPPSHNDVEQVWLRVRDEGDKITMSLKKIDGDQIENQREICLKVDGFNKAVDLLNKIGCIQKSYQETKRELWVLDDVEITIDEWPWLEPFIEVEGCSEARVKKVSEKIGFDYGTAKFCSVTTLYTEKYNIPEKQINAIPEIIFKSSNPFLN
jgi:adenylate cyclase class 2